MVLQESVPMFVAAVLLDDTTKAPVVVLRDWESTVTLPIWIGPLEASAMVVEIEGVETPRPMTHQLMASLLRGLGGVLQSVEITNLQDNIYYALMTLSVQDRRAAIDCRPSDAIVFALQENLPIHVSRKVLEASAVPDGEDTKPVLSSASSKEEMVKALKRMAPKDFKYKT